MQPFQLQGEISRAATLKLVVHSKVIRLGFAYSKMLPGKSGGLFTRQMLLNTQAPFLPMESKMEIIHLVILLGEYQVKAHTYMM